MSKETKSIDNYFEELNKALDDVNNQLEYVKKFSKQILTGVEVLNKVIDNISKSKPEEPATPTMEEVATYFEKNNFTMSPERFYTYNEKRHWAVDGEPIKDWKALAESWQKTQRNKGGR